MGRTEPVKEVQEWHASFDGRQMSDSGQIHNLLNTAFRQHSKPSLARSHHIGVIAENADRIGANHAGADMEYARQ